MIFIYNFLKLQKKLFKKIFKLDTDVCIINNNTALRNKINFDFIFKLFFLYHAQQYNI